MDKQSWMYLTIGVAILGGYFWYQNNKIKTEIKKTGSTKESIAKAAGVTL